MAGFRQVGGRRIIAAVEGVLSENKVIAFCDRFYVVMINVKIVW